MGRHTEPSNAALTYEDNQPTGLMSCQTSHESQFTRYISSFYGLSRCLSSRKEVLAIALYSQFNFSHLLFNSFLGDDLPYDIGHLGYTAQRRIDMIREIIPDKPC